MLLDLDNDPLSPCPQGAVETSIKRAVPGNGTADSYERNNKRGSAKDKERDLPTSTCEQRLNTLTTGVVAERHGYFPFFDSASR